MLWPDAWNVNVVRKHCEAQEAQVRHYFEQYISTFVADRNMWGTVLSTVWGAEYISTFFSPSCTEFVVHDAMLCHWGYQSLSQDTSVLYERLFKTDWEKG